MPQLPFSSDPLSSIWFPGYLDALPFSSCLLNIVLPLAQCIPVSTFWYLQVIIILRDQQSPQFRTTEQYHHLLCIVDLRNYLCPTCSSGKDCLVLSVYCLEWPSDLTYDFSHPLSKAEKSCFHIRCYQCFWGVNYSIWAWFCCWSSCFQKPATYLWALKLSFWICTI